MVNQLNHRVGASAGRTLRDARWSPTGRYATSRVELGTERIHRPFRDWMVIAKNYGAQYAVKEACRSTCAPAALGTSIDGGGATDGQTPTSNKKQPSMWNARGQFNRRKFGGRSTNATTRTQTIF
jgi:hypothetical protein